MSDLLFVVASGEYENYSVDAVFTTRDKAQAYADACNALAVKYAGHPGLSCETKEHAATSHCVEERQLALDPEPPTQWPQDVLERAGRVEPIPETPPRE